MNLPIQSQRTKASRKNSIEKCNRLLKAAIRQRDILFELQITTRNPTQAYPCLATANAEWEKLCPTIGQLIQRNHDSAALAVLRPMIELSCRCYWASLHEHGWDRLLSHQATTGQQMAKKWLRVTPSKDIGLDGFDDRHLEKFKEKPAMPDRFDKVVQQMVEKHNRLEWTQGSPMQHALLSTGVMALSNPIAHFNLLNLAAIRFPDSFAAKHATQLLAVSGMNLALAITQEFKSTPDVLVSVLYPMFEDESELTN